MTIRRSAVLAAVAAVLVVVMGVYSAAAAYLKVDAGVLQAFTFTVDLLDCDEHPDAPRCDQQFATVTFEVRRYSGNSGRDPQVTVVTYRIAAGATYEVRWTGNSIVCPEPAPDPHGVGDDFELGSGAKEITHTVCVGNQQAGNLDVFVDGERLEPESVNDMTVSSLCDGYEDASSCRGDSDQGETR